MSETINIKPVVAIMITWGFIIYFATLLLRWTFPFDYGFNRIPFSWAITMPMIYVWLGVPIFIGFMVCLWSWAYKD
jgi:hypothetical protein